MRAAGARLAELYKTRLGQEVLETLGGAGIAATGQALFTDMTPEEIALSTGLGIGAAAIGRPLLGGAGQALGNKLAKDPRINQFAQESLHEMVNTPYSALNNAVAAKLHPYRDLSAPAQFGSMIGRQYGDNVMQALVALGSPLVMSGDSDA